MTNEEINAGQTPPGERRAEDKAAMKAAKAAERAEKEAARSAARAEAEAARAARAEERAARKGQRNAAKQVAVSERAEQKTAKRAEREAVAAQRKAAKEASAQEVVAEGAPASVMHEAADPAVADHAETGHAETAHADFDHASADHAGADHAETEEPTALPAKLSKEKKPRKSKKVKLSSAKSVRRAIRPIRSRSQQTTARLIWAVFGMALVIVAIVGFWLVLSNQEDSTEVEVLVAAANLTEGNFLEYDDISFATIDIQDGTLAYLPSSNRDSLVGRVILRDVAQDTNLSLDMFGYSNIEDDVFQESEIVFDLEFPGEVILDEDGINAGDRVVILIGQAQSPGRLAFEVVDVETSAESTISLEGSLDYQYWWQQQLARYENQEGIVFEILRVPDPSVAQLCWRERYRQIYQIQALSRSDYEQLIDELECPQYFKESGAGTAFAPAPAIGEDEAPAAGSVAGRLESDRYTADRLVPDEINNPVASGGGGGGGSDPLGDLGIAFPSFPE